MNQYFTYIMASKKNGTLYVGMTNNIERRAHEHKSDFYSGFTKQYKVHRLVYYEMYGDVNGAIRREKRLKKSYRATKIKLIEQRNPEWRDLSDDFILDY